MILRAHRQSAPVWPFWLLLAAWICANMPQVAVFTVLTWMAEGRSFKHQQRLTQDVARLLTGEKSTSPIAEAAARALEHAPAKPLPAVPAEAVLKKIELSLETTCEVLPVALQAGHRIAQDWLCPEPRRYAPPHGPPRLSLA